MSNTIEIFTKEREDGHINYYVYFADYIGEEDFQFAEFLHLLDNQATMYDNIDLHISCTGGSMRIATMIINSMKLTQANIDVFVHARCDSAGADIAISGDSLTMSKHSILMFHPWYCERRGYADSYKTSGEATIRWLEAQIYDYNCPFLTKKEVNNVLDNSKELYIHWDDPTLNARIKRHFKGK